MTEKNYELKSPRFLKREYARYLEEIRRYVRKISPDESLSSGDVWLFDNSYLTVKETKFALDELDRIHLLTFSEKGMPFVLEFAREYLSENNMQISAELLGVYAKTHEEAHFLTLGELEVLPVFLRLELCRMLSLSLAGEKKNGNDFYKALFTAYRVLSSFDTEDLLELSETEKILEDDPSGDYGKMNTMSKSYYRKKLFELSLQKGITERKAAAGLLSESKEKNVHIGHILFPEKTSKSKSFRYLTLQFLLAALGSLLFAYLLGNWWLSFAVLLPVFEVVKKVQDFIILKCRRPKPIFSLELKDGIPDGHRTAIVFSALVVSEGDVEKLMKSLRRLWYTNNDKNLIYGVLADFKDSGNKKEKKDAALKEALEDGISELERQLSPSFFCVLRERSYNDREKIYMGKERKRGAVCEFVRYIAEGEKPEGSLFGCMEKVRDTKYIIALDADTFLPVSGARELAGAMLHPLNKPVVNKEKGIVEKGYGMIVPKISATLSSSTKSGFARAFAGFGGTQTYNNPDYDLYFDIFEESSFTGKGIFDVAAFHETAEKKLPDNKILSHDLVEGFFLRTGYLGSVCLTDSFPSSILSYFNRLHRWYRGDVQSLIFLFSKVKTGEGKIKTYVSLKNKYKLFDNIRRMFTSPAVLLCLLLGYFHISLFIAALVSLFCGQLITILDILIHNGKRALKIRYSSRTLPVLQSVSLSCFYSLMLLPYQSLTAIHAFLLTLWRMIVTRKNLLKWTTAAQADTKYRGTVLEYYEKMAVSPIIGLVFLLLPRPVLAVTGTLFLLSPLFSYVLSRESKADMQIIREKDRETLVSYAREMYRYYADFMNEENNFLPPDNFQEEPLFCLAKRTSPTNIGLALLCHVGAYDLGIITKEQLFERISLTADSLKRMEKYRGHLYNWYDNVALKPLSPRYISTVDSGNLAVSLLTLYEALRQTDCPKELLLKIKRLETAMDFSFLYHEKKQLLYIGCDSKGVTGDSLYDLFMSECRMTSYYLVAKGLLPKKHWFSMGRLFTGELGYFGLKSWTGTMFEYLMPNLFLPVVQDSLIYEATSFAITSQKRRVDGKNIPYGISESGFYSFDRFLFYQYKAFGVQMLGLKKGLDSETVISPYSTFLTLPYDLSGAMDNLEWLRRLGAFGKYGFYEAIDFTKSRINGEQAIVKSYMAHHVGMSMLAICNLLLDNIFQKRFMADPEQDSFRELLEERLPETVTFYNDEEVKEVPEIERKPHSEKSNEISLFGEKGVILSNGILSCLLTDNGCGFLKYKESNVTRYRQDNFKYPLGVFSFLTDGGRDYSLTYAPFYDNSLDYKASLSEDRAVYYLNAKGFHTRLLVTQHKSLPAQFYELTVSNWSGLVKKDRATFYLEPTLARHSDEQSHPAFSSLFTCVSYDNRGFVLFTRRRRLETDNEIWMAAGLITKHGGLVYETMRENILPRLDGVKKIDLQPGSFKGVSPSPIDPCFAVSVELDLLPRGKTKMTLLICCGNTKEEASRLFESIKKKGTAKLMTECLPLYARLPEKEQALVSKLLPSLYYPKTLYHNPLPGITSQRELWQYGISGDLPIISLCVDKREDIPLVKSAVRIFSHLSMKGVECDFAIFYYEEGDYQRPIQNSIKSIVSSLQADNLTEKRGGIFLINEKEDNRGLLLRISVFVFNEDRQRNMLSGRFTPFLPARGKDMPNREELMCQTQTGGFGEGGYKVTAKDFWSFRPPYCMVLANRSFGTLLSDSSLGYSYAINARENKLTPWSNDSVYDNSGEKLFLRIDGEIYDLCREGHSFLKPDEVQYTAVIKEIECLIRVYVHPVKCCKYIDVTLRNLSAEKRDLKICMYLEPVMGVAERGNSGLINIVKEQNALCFHSAIESGFGGFAYLSLNEEGFSTTNRLLFLQGIWDSGISENVLPCCVRGTDLSLKGEEEKELRFILGYSKSIRGMENVLFDNYKKSTECFPVKIRTPDETLDLLYNDFLLGQVLGARIFARTGFYQCGGAFGFRDQLQDAICVSVLYPELLKRQIYRCAANQFEEGDVLHWWHEFYQKKERRRSRGVRTRCSDDLLWLPLAVCEYTEKTGDFSLLDVRIHYLKDRELEEDELEAYLSPDYSETRESVYLHCMRALKKGCNFGENGLLLMGSGDWNDGMNLVGAEGKGTSVWLSMFVVLVLERFSMISERVDDREGLDFCVNTAIALRTAIEREAYDGKYYLRAFFDNGDPMGSKDSDECKIDLLPQSFAALINLDEKRVKSALDAAGKQLVNEKYGVISLFTPPFDNSKNNPGYIKSYIPGIRENGGQYTHGALWFVLGLIRNGQTDRAYELLKIINPVNHALSNKDAKRYRTEPYSLCGDVYLAKGLEGRGGWSQYTGSAGWFFKIVTEELLGLRRIDGAYEFHPRLPSQWQSAEIEVTENGETFIFTAKKDENDEG